MDNANQTVRPPPVDQSGSYHPFRDGFCSDQFWDLNVLWYTSNPNFTECFQKTALIWMPCAFLWLMIPVQAYRSRSGKFRIRRWTSVSLCKAILAIVLTVLCLVDMFRVVHVWNTVGLDGLPDVDIVEPVLKAATFVLAAGCIFSERRHAKPTSAILFIFWLLILIHGIIRFRTVVEQAAYKGIDDGLSFMIQLIYFPTVIAQFILSCFADYFPELASTDPNPSPEQFSSVPSRITFWWITGLIYLGWKRPLTQPDLWDLSANHKAEKYSASLTKHWSYELSRMPKVALTLSEGVANKTQKGYEPSLTKALFKTILGPFFMCGILKLINDLCTFIAPQVLKLLIGFVSDTSQEPWKGFLYVAAMFVGSFATTLAMSHYWIESEFAGIDLRAAVVSCVYQKALKLSNSAKRSSTVGEIVNLMSVDSQRFNQVLAQLHMLWSCPLQIAISLYLLWQEMGLATLAGVGAMIVVMPINAFVAGRSQKLMIENMKQKDGRIKLMNEILNGMKILKLYAWEESFEQRVINIRNKELVSLKKTAVLNACSMFVMLLTPFLVALVTFMTFVLMGDEPLTAQRAFVSLSLFNVLQRPLAILPDVITILVQANVSVKRLRKFFLNDELDLNCVRELPSLNEPNSIVVTEGSFSWGKDEKPCLQNVNFTVKTGELVAVVGQVGSGKSSLVAATLGLMENLSGDIALKGTIAYVTQQAWIQNMTLKENILFGKPFDARRYDQVLEACALKPDLQMLSAGDMTEIGEKGINLSGGQKQRISLARAVYSGADVYFLDDPLSAVDAHVGKHIFEHVIGKTGILYNKTRILVTHGIGFLPQTDLIVVVDNATISETGTYKELLNNQGAFAEFLRTYLIGAPEDELDADDPESVAIKNEIFRKIGRLQRATSTTSTASSTTSRVKSVLRQRSTISGRRLSEQPHDATKKTEIIPLTPVNDVKGQLVGAEKSEIGGVPWSIYVVFLRQMTWPVFFIMLISYGLASGSSLGTSIWLGYWASDSSFPDRVNSTSWRDFRLGIYGGLGGLQAFFVFSSSLALAVGQILASRKQHEGMLHQIMRAPMSFFDTTPLGRIVNRFSKDVDSVDTMIPMMFRMLLYCIFQVLSAVIAICITTPVFAAVVPPLGIIYYTFQRFFIPSSRQIKRLESVSRSPLYSHFQESIGGSNIIIAQKQMERFSSENERLVDVNNTSIVTSAVANRWVAVRLEFVGNFVVLFAGLFAVLGRDRDWGINPNDIGLSVSYALTVTHILNMMVRVVAELESNIVSVERIKEYSETPLEADWVIEKRRPQKEWPVEGRVMFKNYETRYRPGLDLVLKGVSCDIASGEKVGIVGRTGAGKSSLTVALFRIIEAAGGSIVIDGINIADLGLHDVRSRLTIIPQEPILFSGTLRLNLDPFDAFTDEEVWRSLDSAHLTRFVNTLPEGLHHVVAEGGENLSVGQRQLVCLARALLRKTKILILDEATAAIDLETDALIQATIRDKFADCTILTIAHRLNTIMDSTRIMVMDQGTVKEFASPATLLSDKTGIFYGLAKSANLVS